MPTRPKRPCAQPGCPTLVKAGRCPEHERHKRQAEDARRGTARERGYTREWEIARAAHLRAEPLCRMCRQAGRTTSASVVDHITPHRGDMTLFWDASNWQSLCKPCHDGAKQREERGGGAGPIPGRVGHRTDRKSVV